MSQRPMSLEDNFDSLPIHAPRGRVLNTPRGRRLGLDEPHRISKNRVAWASTKGGNVLADVPMTALGSTKPLHPTQNNPQKRT